MEQSVAISRLGPSNILKRCPQHLSLHWLLDWTNPEHEEVAHVLVKEAQGEDVQNWFNLLLSGAIPCLRGCTCFIAKLQVVLCMMIVRRCMGSKEAVALYCTTRIANMRSHYRTEARRGGNLHVPLYTVLPWTHL